MTGLLGIMKQKTLGTTPKLGIPGLGKDSLEPGKDLGMGLLKKKPFRPSTSTEVKPPKSLAARLTGK